MLRKQLCHVRKHRFIHDRRIIFRIEDRNRHAPCTLTGNTPVAAVCDHIVHALFAPCRDPFHLIDLLQQFFSDLIDRCEPLRRRTINDRLFRTPVMRIRMRDKFQFQQGAQFIQTLGDGLVGVFHILSF